MFRGAVLGRLGLRLGNIKVSRLLAWITRRVQLLKRTKIKRVQHTPGKTHCFLKLHACDGRQALQIGVQIKVIIGLIWFRVSVCLFGFVFNFFHEPLASRQQYRLPVRLVGL